MPRHAFTYGSLLSCIMNKSMEADTSSTSIQGTQRHGSSRACNDCRTCTTSTPSKETNVNTVPLHHVAQDVVCLSRSRPDSCPIRQRSAMRCRVRARAAMANVLGLEEVGTLRSKGARPKVLRGILVSYAELYFAASPPSSRLIEGLSKDVTASR